MEIFLQQLVNGVVLGSIYALVALGYTLVYGIMGLINFAHGDVVMLGAMVTLAVVHLLSGSGLPGPMVAAIGVLAAIPACMMTGFLIERIAYRPLRSAPRLAPLITAIGVSMLLQNLAMMVWGREYLSFPQLLPAATYPIGGASISFIQIIIIVSSSLMMAGLSYLVKKTRLGNAMRATSQNPEVSALLGVNVNSIISVTFIIGSALAAVAGMMVSAYYGIAHYDMGFILGLKAFTAAVLGGIGNIEGAMVGGLLLGVIESMGAGYLGTLTGGAMGSNYQDVFAFFVLIVVLIFRPSGLLGERIGERP